MAKHVRSGFTGAQGAPGESSVMLVTSRVREDRHTGVTRAAPGEAEYARGEPGRVGVVSQGHTTRAAPPEVYLYDQGGYISHSEAGESIRREPIAASAVVVRRT